MLLQYQRRRARRSTAGQEDDPGPSVREEVTDILNDAWRDPDWGVLLWLVMVTGCRRGELCALRFSDLDLDRHRIALERAIARTKTDVTGLKEKRPKQDKERRLTLDPYTVGLLRTHREAVEAQCRAAGVKLARDAFVAWQEAADGGAAEVISRVIPRPQLTPRRPHEIIAADLRRQIGAGTYPVGALLPKNEDIRQQYKVATGTVSRAIHQLRDEGLPSVVTGKRPKVVALP